jgi:formylmethanofuran dehydrogenase subunit D
MRRKGNEMKGGAQADNAKIRSSVFEQDKIYDIYVTHRKYLRIQPEDMDKWNESCAFKVQVTDRIN